MAHTHLFDTRFKPAATRVATAEARLSRRISWSVAAAVSLGMWLILGLAVSKLVALLHL